jgi:hypothetical protein
VVRRKLKAWHSKRRIQAFLFKPLNPEPFDSPLVLSLSKDERISQDRLVEDERVRGDFIKEFHLYSPLKVREDEGGVWGGKTLPSFPFGKGD